MDKQIILLKQRIHNSNRIIKHLIAIFLLSLFSTAYSQLPQDDVMIMVLSPGDSALMAKNYKAAILLYNRALKAGQSEIRIARNLSVAYALNGNVDSAFYFLNRVIILDKSRYIGFILKDPDYFLLINDKRWREIESTSAEQYFQRYSVKNRKLCLKLLQMFMFDQAYYSVIEYLNGERGSHDPEIARLWSIKDSLNKNNIKELESIIAQYGYPTKDQVGEDASASTFFIIQHADLNIQKKYLPLIEKLAFNNEIKKTNYAMLKDRILVSEGKNQVYGTQIKQEKDGSNVFFPIEDSINVNKRRDEMEFNESLTDYLERYNRQFSRLPTNNKQTK